MLKILRNKKTAKKVWIGLALIIIPAFAFWGFGGAGSGSEENKPLGKVFGRQISALELRDAVSAVTTSAIMRFGDKFPEVKEYLNLEAQAWQRLVLLDEAKKRGIKASDQEVVELIEGLPYLQYKGRFDKNAYEQTLRYVFRLKPRVFEEQTRQNIMLNKLYKQITDNLKVEDKDVLAEYEKENQKISVYYIGSLIPDLAKTIKPKEGELKDYFEKNKGSFSQPVTAGKEGKETFIPEFKTIKQKVKDAFVKDAAVKLAEEKINLCAKELKSAKFKDAARKCGLRVKETPSFNLGSAIEGIGQSGDFWKIAKSLPVGQASPVIRLPQGFYIIKVKSTEAIDEKKYEKEKPDYAKKLLGREKEEKFTLFMTELNEKAR